jgi:hypothetical protein
MNKSHRGKVEAGKFIPDDKLVFKLAFATFEGKECDVIIKPKARSKNRQFRYLYSVVYQLIADQVGTTPDRIDDLMKRKFMFDVVLGARVAKKKTSVSNDEFTQYITNVINWAEEFFEGLRIPKPNEVGLE